MSTISLWTILSAALALVGLHVHASPFIFITSHHPKCLEVDGNAGMSLHLHYYAPNLKVGTHPRDKWNDMRHHHEAEAIHSGRHNLHENIQRHAHMATGLNEENSPISQRWEQAVKKMQLTHHTVEEDKVSNLSVSFSRGSTDQPQSGLSAKTNRHLITDKTGTLRYDVQEPTTVKACFHCFSCSLNTPLMIATEIHETPTALLDDVKQTVGNVRNLNNAVQNAQEKIRDLKDTSGSSNGSIINNTTTTTTSTEMQRARDAFKAQQMHGKNHLGYLKHEVKGMMVYLDTELKKTVTIQHMESTMYRDGVRFQKSSTFYPTMKILILIIATTMQARALVAHLKKLHII